MFTAAFWAFVGAGALIVGALLGFWLNVSKKTLGLIMGFGAGTLISAISFDLVAEAFSEAPGLPLVGGLLAGALAFWGGDLILERTIAFIQSFAAGSILASRPRREQSGSATG